MIIIVYGQRSFPRNCNRWDRIFFSTLFRSHTGQSRGSGSGTGSVPVDERKATSRRASFILTSVTSIQPIVSRSFREWPYLLFYRFFFSRIISLRLSDLISLSLCSTMELRGAPPTTSIIVHQGPYLSHRSLDKRKFFFLPRSQGHSTNRRLLFFSFFFS